MKPSEERKNKLIGIVATVIFLSLALSIVKASDIAPLRHISDPRPTFSGIAVDTVNDEIVASDVVNHAIYVFNRNDKDLVKPIRVIQGDKTELEFPATLFVDTVNDEIVTVLNDTADSVVVFKRTADGNVPPLRAIRGGNTQMYRPYGVFVDTVNDEIFVTNERIQLITVFSRKADGDVAPLRVIQGERTEMATPKGIFVDTVHNEILVTNFGSAHPNIIKPPSITVYPRTAQGDVRPLRIIQGQNTQLNIGWPIAVDQERDEIIVANGGPNSAILFFERTAQGNVPPKRIIKGEDTGLRNPAGVSVDNKNDELAVTNWRNHSITIYPLDAQGNAPPLRTLRGDKDEEIVGIVNPGAIAVDTEHDEIIEVNCVSRYSIAFFPRKATGHVPPVRVIEGQNARIGRSHGIAYDPVNDEVLVADNLADFIAVYKRTDDGEVPPLRVIEGSLTGLSPTWSVAVDPINDEIFVPNARSSTITVYPRLANGNVVPIRTLDLRPSGECYESG
jgi:6-phosphogluconolactonase (cycloisomerase 2 family)